MLYSHVSASWCGMYILVKSTLRWKYDKTKPGGFEYGCIKYSCRKRNGCRGYPSSYLNVALRDYRHKYSCSGGFHGHDTMFYAYSKNTRNIYYNERAWHSRACDSTLKVRIVDIYTSCRVPANYWVFALMDCLLVNHRICLRLQSNLIVLATIFWCLFSARHNIQKVKS